MSLSVSLVKTSQSRNTEYIGSFTVTIDNSTGTTDITQQLVSENTYIMHAVILNDPDSTSHCFIGGENPEFKLVPGAAYTTYINDLSKIHVKVPAGGSVTLYIIYER